MPCYSYLLEPSFLAHNFKLLIFPEVQPLAYLARALILDTGLSFRQLANIKNIQPISKYDIDFRFADDDGPTRVQTLIQNTYTVKAIVNLRARKFKAQSTIKLKHKSPLFREVGPHALVALHNRITNTPQTIALDKYDFSSSEPLADILGETRRSTEKIFRYTLRAVENRMTVDQLELAEPILFDLWKNKITDVGRAAIEKRLNCPTAMASNINQILKTAIRLDPALDTLIKPANRGGT